jgi:hypothetical protein
MTVVHAQQHFYTWTKQFETDTDGVISNNGNNAVLLAQQVILFTIGREFQ